MNVENAHAFLETIKKEGPSPALLSKIGIEFNADHMAQAMREKGTSKDDLLKKAAGGAATSGWTGEQSTAVCTSASAAAA